MNNENVKEVVRKRPQSTYGKRPPIVRSIENDKVTDANFISKVLEVLHPEDNKEGDSCGKDHEINDESDDEKPCVKNVHELLESGQYNRLSDELEYAISGIEELQCTNPLRPIIKRSLIEYFVGIGKNIFTLKSSLEASRLRSSGIFSRLLAAVQPFAHIDTVSLRFQFALIHVIGFSIRRLDYFISIEDCLKLAHSLAESENDGREAKLDHFYESLDPALFESNLDMALWLYTKVVNSIWNSNPLCISDENISIIISFLLQSCSEEAFLDKNELCLNRIFYLLGFLSSIDADIAIILAELLKKVSLDGNVPLSYRSSIVQSIFLLIKSKNALSESLINNLIDLHPIIHSIPTQINEYRSLISLSETTTDLTSIMSCHQCIDLMNNTEGETFMIEK